MIRYKDPDLGILSSLGKSMQLIWRSKTRRFHVRCPTIYWVAVTWLYDKAQIYISSDDIYQSDVPYLAPRFGSLLCSSGVTKAWLSKNMILNLGDMKTRSCAFAVTLCPRILIPVVSIYLLYIPIFNQTNCYEHFVCRFMQTTRDLLFSCIMQE